MTEPHHIDPAAPEYRRAVEATLEQILDGAIIARALRDRQGAIVDFRVDFVNDRFVEFAGRAREDLVGKRLGDIYPRLRDSEELKAYANVVTTGTPFAAENVIHEQQPSGATRLGDTYVSKFGDGLLGLWRDVTERVLAMAELERSQTHLAEAHRLAELGTFEFDLETGALWWSEELYRISGLDPTERQITSIPDCVRLIHADDVARIPEIIERACTSRQPVREEFRFLRPDGEHGVASVIIDVAVDHEGAVVSLRGTALDVTQQRQQEVALLAHQHALEEAQRLASLGSWYYDSSANTVVWSAQTFELFGLAYGTPPPAPGRWGVYVHPDDHRLVHEARRATAARHPFRYEARLRRADGGEWIAAVIGEPVTGTEGELIGVRGTVQDITTLRRTQEALAESRTALVVERQTVDVLQQSVLPVELPELPELELVAHYSSAASGLLVGGDWYDAFVRPDGTVVLMVGDVAGHGLPAAGLMAQLRNATRAYAFEDDDPANVLHRLDALTHKLYPGEMATAVLGYHDRTRQRLRWARAGHPYPLLAGTDGVTALTDADGMPLGAGRTDALAYSVGEHAFPEGACVLFYSDGLIERPGVALDDGVNRIIEVLARCSDNVTALATALIDAVPGDTVDDRCFLIARRRAHQRSDGPTLATSR